MTEPNYTSKVITINKMLKIKGKGVIVRVKRISFMKIFGKFYSENKLTEN